MTKILLIYVFILQLLSSDFLGEQKRYPRVREAIADKLDIVKNTFKEKDVEFPPKEIFLRAFKSEMILELWARSTNVDTFCLIKTYSFCASSGVPGPKRKQGDLQIPEGFYYIDRFNAQSSFYLSLGLNYPNESDKLLSKNKNRGGDIFIHGDCVTIGCIPITDPLIKEVYLCAIFTRNNGQNKIPVHIFPTIMTIENLKQLNDRSDMRFKHFWDNLKSGYDNFEESHSLPRIIVDPATGKYIFN